MTKKLFQLTLAVALAAIGLVADSNRGYVQGFCAQSPLTRTNSPVTGCTIIVKNAYTGASATLYSDNTGAGTSLANSFTVATTGWTFYADDGVYLVTVSGTFTNGNTFSSTSGPVTILNGSTVSSVIGSITPTTAGGATIGSASLPFSSAYIGNAATNNIRLTGTGASARVVTLPDATDTLVGKATTDVLTNKTFDTAGSGNVFQIAGLGVTASTGTGSMVRATTPTLVTPVLGVATITSLNKVTITQPAGSAVLTISDGKTLAATAGMVLAAGADDQTFTFPASSDTVVTLGATQTLTAKTLTSAAVTTDIRATTAGAGTLGTAAKPFGSLYLGTAATNNMIVTPAAFGQATTASVVDPGMTAATFPLVKRGTITWTTAQVNAGACTAAQTAAVTSLATTASVGGSPQAADANYDNGGLIAHWYPTAGTVNVKICNGGAGNITPTGASIVFNYFAFVP